MKFQDYLEERLGGMKKHLEPLHDKAVDNIVKSKKKEITIDHLEDEIAKYVKDWDDINVDYATDELKKKGIKVKI